jgi:flagellar hook-length control protein FliK
MSSLAIPAAPPPAPTDAANSAAPSTGDGSFGDALRESQARPETKPGGRVAAKGPAPRNTGDKADAGSHDGREEDGHATKPADAKHPDSNIDAALTPPPAAPLASPMAATARQPSAANGNPLPPATTPAVAVKGASPAMAASAAPVQDAAPIATTRAASPGVPATAPPAPASDAGLAAAPGTPPETGAPADAGNGTEAISRKAPDDFAAQLTQLFAAHAATPASPAQAPVQLAMQATPQQMPQFAQETAQHVVWLAGQAIQKAEIRLNPGKLGPIQVEIATHHDRVDVNFAVQHPQTVHALQQALPQLHDMLAQQGLNLGQASVGQQSPGQQHATFAQHAGFGGSGPDTGTAEADPPPGWRSVRIATPGRVDDFA